jgi:hypothetical protein
LLPTSQGWRAYQALAVRSDQRGVWAEAGPAQKNIDATERKAINEVGKHPRNFFKEKSLREDSVPKFEVKMVRGTDRSKYGSFKVQIVQSTDRSKYGCFEVKIV